MADGFEQVARRVLGGDVAAVDELGVGERADSAAGRLPVLGRDAVVSVLEGLRDGRYEQDEVQRWAAFVRHGFVPGAAGSPETPVLIDYDPEWDEGIAQAVDALDGLGDVVDGELGPTMIDQLVEDLSD